MSSKLYGKTINAMCTDQEPIRCDSDSSRSDVTTTILNIEDEFPFAEYLPSSSKLTISLLAALDASSINKVVTQVNCSSYKGVTFFYGPFVHCVLSTARVMNFSARP
jgi:hypothetical protein